MCFVLIQRLELQHLFHLLGEKKKIVPFFSLSLCLSSTRMCRTASYPMVAGSREVCEISPPQIYFLNKNKIKTKQKTFFSCVEQAQLNAEIKTLKKSIRQATSIMQMEELKCRKRVLRRYLFIKFLVFSGNKILFYFEDWDTPPHQTSSR